MSLFGQCVLHCRLMDAAAAAQQTRCPELRLHQVLLQQLQDCEEVAELSPQELLAEMQAMQLAAMYGGDDAKHSKTKLLGSNTEEFLVQQVCTCNCQ